MSELARNGLMAAGEASAQTLYYTARAGLLSELSRQTYDSLYKALREAVLNGIDAGADRVTIQFTHSADGPGLRVRDNGHGMDLRALRDAFMSLGGSAKFNDPAKYGRIGIGSLALLTYGSEAIVKTRRKGMATVVRAHLFHPQRLDRTARAQDLTAFPAGIATEEPYEGDPDDHFTTIELRGITPEAERVVTDPTATYALLDRLARVLPLPVRPGSRLYEALQSCSSDVASCLRKHIRDWSVPILVETPWSGPTELARRTYGDEPGEEWTGDLHPVWKAIRVASEQGYRTIHVGGYLLAQRHARASWMGLTARVQNVAVEEQTFFDVTADPGFRKYITGEVFLIGDVDTDRLININRTSFNRESVDYQAVQRVMQNEIEAFKRKRVAAPQRQKTKARRALDRRRAIIQAIRQVVEAANDETTGRKGLPSSNNGAFKTRKALSLADFLGDVDLLVEEIPEMPALDFEVCLPEGGAGLTAKISADLCEPSVDARGVRYALRFYESDRRDPPVLIRNRPREIMVNLGHPTCRERDPSRIATAVAIEIAYLDAVSEDSAEMYDRLMDLMVRLAE